MERFVPIRRDCEPDRAGLRVRERRLGARRGTLVQGIDLLLFLLFFRLLLLFLLVFEV